MLPLPLLALLLASCGLEPSPAIPEVTNANSSCPANAAQIEVSDGFLRSRCGCAEAITDPVPPPATLTCTVTKDSTVTFLYVGTETTHQIVSTDTPAFASSPLSDPSDISTIRVHAINLSIVGTYKFTDSQNSALSGSIVVR